MKLNLWVSLNSSMHIYIHEYIHACLSHSDAAQAAQGIILDLQRRLELRDLHEVTAKVKEAVGLFVNEHAAEPLATKIKRIEVWVQQSNARLLALERTANAASSGRPTSMF